ncbi:MAG: hypothetical protein RMM51_03150 [Verrucomicrobiae bacterium]|nr:hypothetical protein [Verrucomicrobiae bacterium]
MNRAWLWAGLAVTAAVAAFYWDWLTGRAHIWGDTMAEYFPGLHYFATSVRSGRFPLWISEVRNGLPFYTDIQLGIFYPPTWCLVAVASEERLPSLAYQWFIVAHIAWAGIGMLWFLRGLGVRPEAGVPGAMTFVLSAFMSLHTVHAVMLQGYAWWPWLMECVRRAVTRRSKTALASLLTVAAMMVLAGHPQIALYGWYLATAFWIYLGWKSSKWWRCVAEPVAVWAITLLVLGVVLLPVAENWWLSGRAEAARGAMAEGSAPWPNLVSLVAPNFFGTLQAGESPVMFWGDAPFASRPVAPWNYWEFGIYAGQLAVVALAVLMFNRRKPVGFFLAMFAFGLWFYLGRYGGLFSAASWVLPGVSLFRVPARAASVICFCGAVLVAFLVEAVHAANGCDWDGRLRCWAQSMA